MLGQSIYVLVSCIKEIIDENIQEIVLSWTQFFLQSSKLLGFFLTLRIRK